MSNALDAALVELAMASTALERTHRPSLKDVEEAKDKAKKASKILEAAHSLMSLEIYSVADAPALPGTPLPFPPSGPAVPPPMPKPEQPREDLPTLGYTEAEVVPTDPAPCGWDEKDATDQDQMFHNTLSDLESACQTEGGSLKGLGAQAQKWVEFYGTDRRAAWIALYAVYYGGASSESMPIPAPEEVPELLAAAREGEDA